MQPRNPVQNRVAVLLRTADRNMEMAESAVRHTPHLHENIGFQCQQAVEKYAKAVLLANQLPAPFIHVLVKLLLPLVERSIVELNEADMKAAVFLQDFAVEWRYEIDEAPEYTSADLLAMAQRFRSLLRPLAETFLT